MKNLHPEVAPAVLSNGLFDKVTNQQPFQYQQRHQQCAQSLDSPKHQVHHLTLKAPVHETVVDNIEQRIARAEQEGNRDHFQRSAAQNLHGAAWGFVLFLLDLQEILLLHQLFRFGLLLLELLVELHHKVVAGRHVSVPAEAAHRGSRSLNARVAKYIMHRGSRRGHLLVESSGQILHCLDFQHNHGVRFCPQASVDLRHNLHTVDGVEAHGGEV
mmetsp:Transcript_44247/g.84605  ORF Transcript_44247/g.84605 Transcript_44247/m.84605 type:complete len:215 (+) Transcript_44247:3744-4388(+)